MQEMVNIAPGPNTIQWYDQGALRSALTSTNVGRINAFAKHLTVKVRPPIDSSAALGYRTTLLLANIKIFQFEMRTSGSLQTV